MKNVLNALKELLEELSSEIDLHYEDDDLVAARPTIEKMRKAGDILACHGVGQPEAFLHVSARLDRVAHRPA